MIVSHTGSEPKLVPRSKCKPPRKPPSAKEKARRREHWQQIKAARHARVMSVFSDLTACARGQVDAVLGGWFYRLFRHRTGLQPTQIQRLLARAWWLEEEDIQQQLLCLATQYRLWPARQIEVALLAYRLADWLIQQRVFVRAMTFDYDIEVGLYQEPEPDYSPLQVILDPHLVDEAPYDRYLLYLYHLLMLKAKDVEKYTQMSYKELFRAYYMKQLNRRFVRAYPIHSGRNHQTVSLAQWSWY